ncbi:hypothetical protein FM076_29515 [Streptomyces albus subsp. chlorinus]|uniref:hypothetical protein n=2 Tax=Streptomyces TaxID=1883 RepID=UPI00156EFB04|nr:hypothetical protein [Streptomyces albus]NSC25076.1 hypothetical protein [Streptomyces albus subsp. chlorinus]
MTDPTADPNFSGIKQPVFDDLVGSHGRAASALEQLAQDLWAELNRMGIDTSPATRLRGLAQRVRTQATDLQARQSRVHAMQQEGSGGAPYRTPSGTFWEVGEAATPSPRPGAPPPTDPARLSYELWNANFLPRPGRLRPDGTPFSREEDAVLSWIETNKQTIIEEARKWNISPQAVAAAIAWEAMENVQPFRHPIPAKSGLGRVHQRFARWATGPGKVHTDFPLVKQVEDRGYLPRQGLAEREALLSSSKGSITYIAAIMGAFADSADRDGRYHIRYDVPALTHLFQGSDLEQWERRLREKPRDEPLSPKNPMAEWAKRNRVFLDSAMPLRPWDKDPTPTTPTPQPPPTPEPTPGPSPTPR